MVYKSKEREIWGVWSGFLMVVSPATAVFLRKRRILGAITLLGGGPGSGCRGPNCGRPRGAEKPETPVWRQGKMIDTKDVANYVTALGKSWVDKIIAGDSKIQDWLTKWNEADSRDKATEKAMDKLGGWLTHFWNSPKEERNLDLFDKVSGKQTALAYKASAYFNEKQALNQQISDRIAEKLRAENVVNPGKPMDIGFSDYDHAIPEDQQFRIEYAARQFEKMLGTGQVGKENRVTFTGTNHERSFYEVLPNQIHLRDRAGKETIWHEMGHWLEHQLPGGTLAAQSYLDSRTKGEQEKKLSEVDNKPGYTPDEVSRKDHFVEPYVGKIYKDGNSTEVTSMGMQYLAEDPAKLYRWDKDHLYFTLGMIRAAQMGGFPWKQK